MQKQCDVVVIFSPGLNPPAETQPHHRHAAEHAAEVERTRVPPQRRRHARSYSLGKH